MTCDPMSHAGLRRVMLSAEAMITSIGHIDAFTEPSPDRWVFTAGKGGPAREAALCAAWVEAATACGVPHAHLHELRHFGGTLAVSPVQPRARYAFLRSELIMKH